MRKLILKHWLLVVAITLGLLGMSFLRWRENQHGLRRFEDIQKEEPDAVDLKLSEDIWQSEDIKDGEPVRAASAIKTWSSGEVVRATDLNANFTHLHDNLGHAHGAILANGDISNTAAIAHSKLQTPALVPKAWAAVGLAGACACSDAADATTCTLSASSQVLTVKSSGTAGLCRVTLSYTPADANFAVIPSVYEADKVCTVESLSTSAPHFLIRCKTTAAAAANSIFAFAVLD